MMRVKVKFFAIARDIVGTSEKVLVLPLESAASTVLDALVTENPRLGEWKNYLRIAVNSQYVSLEQKLHDQDEVAIIPPVSGG